MRKRLLTLGCTAALTLAYFTAPTALAEENTEASTEAESYITVTDMNGRDVQVPTEIDSVVLTALPLPSIYALTGAPIENLKGVHPGSTSAIEFAPLLEVQNNSSPYRNAQKRQSHKKL